MSITFVNDCKITNAFKSDSRLESLNGESNDSNLDAMVDKRPIPRTMELSEYYETFVKPNIQYRESTCAHLRLVTRGIRLISLFDAQGKLPSELRDLNLIASHEIEIGSSTDSIIASLAETVLDFSSFIRKFSFF